MVHTPYTTTITILGLKRPSITIIVCGEKKSFFHVPFFGLQICGFTFFN
jgi:hypothetical protein